MIGWAYLVGCLVYLVCGDNRTALLGCAVLLLCLYPADRTGRFAGFWLSNYVGIGGTLGSQASITVAGMLLAASLKVPDADAAWRSTRFSFCFIGTCAGSAWLLHGLYGINKNSATPSWCLWACAITATLWLGLHWLLDARSAGRLARVLVLAGQNVLLAYLLSELLPSALDLVGLDRWYSGIGERGLGLAVARSAGCGVLLLATTVGLNRVGFRLKL